MAAKEKTTSKLTLLPLVLMIFTSVFGFTNMPRSFYLMGYGAIPWYLLSGITFFLPYAFMLAEYGAAFKNKKGGIYSWMEESIGPKYAFIGTFMWYASYVVWMVNVASAIWIPLSNSIFGKDTTSTWTLFGLSSTQTLGLLGMVWIILVTFIASKGLDKITKVTSIGGTAVALLNIVLLVGALFVLAANHGHFAQPILSAQSFIKSPNHSYGTPIAMLSFIVFALFAYGGIEAVGGLVDRTEKAEVVFPKAVTISAIIIAIAYSLGIFLIGIFINWNHVLASNNVNMANVAYIVMQNLGYQVGHGLGLNEVSALTLGAWVARLVGLSMFLALTGAFFTLIYAPLKQMIEGTPAELWPGKMSEVKNGMPLNAMWIQCLVVIVMIFIVSFGGQAASAFFNKLVLMTNVAMTIPCMFISGAYAAFKKKTDIAKPFVVFKSYKSALLVTIIVTFTVGFANFFTIIQPATQGDLQSTIWMISGPVFFTVVAFWMYHRYEKKKKIHQPLPKYAAK
ncbi:inner membrane transporter YjeM [Desulfosporosinus acididurans]|uniref:Inner membrane transporter YjeM n=1 Tax=Desulfosporosinus acididurans TaxID=476652 RepID=A0A0J1FMJ6_9FIRM|nr:glutamate/gamma-aminobutyrate family transporter YjeM [Desulfosporosinus acididurans]KLU64193.1 inner membrane transporter YjeM [Desulfosporosinus acididurans]